MDLKDVIGASQQNPPTAFVTPFSKTLCLLIAVPSQPPGGLSLSVATMVGQTNVPGRPEWFSSTVSLGT